MVVLVAFKLENLEVPHCTHFQVRISHLRFLWNRINDKEKKTEEFVDRLEVYNTVRKYW